MWGAAGRWVDEGPGMVLRDSEGSHGFALPPRRSRRGPPGCGVKGASLYPATCL